MKLEGENCIWHAFDYLAMENGRQSANKSKLKVLTSNIGHILGKVGVENGLDVFRSTPPLTFEQYRFYLNTELLNSLEDTEISVSSALSLEGRMSSVCWLICSPSYLERTGPLLPASCVLQLWRIF